MISDICIITLNIFGLTLKLRNKNFTIAFKWPNLS